MSDSQENNNELDLGVVQETLLIPLYFRAKETRRPDAICRDEHAVRIVDQLPYDFKKFDSWPMQMDVAVRTEVFDEQTRLFLTRHPNAAVINLGAGLDARGLRLDNGTLVWIDLDMPDAIALRRRFFAESERCIAIDKSMFDLTWLDDAAQVVGSRPVLCIAEGLFTYFHEQQIRQLLSAIADRWPGAEILFQSISPQFVQKQHRVGAVNKTKASFLWGVESGREVAAWRDDYQFLGEWAFFDRHRRRWRYFVWAAFFWPPLKRSLRQVLKVSHVRLG